MFPMRNGRRTCFRLHTLPYSAFTSSTHPPKIWCAGWVRMNRRTTALSMRWTATRQPWTSPKSVPDCARQTVRFLGRRNPSACMWTTRRWHKAKSMWTSCNRDSASWLICWLQVMFCAFVRKKKIRLSASLWQEPSLWWCLARTSTVRVW